MDKENGLAEVLRGRASTPTRPILVTGSHCSGSTWVGRMIAASPTVRYIHEPFNIYNELCPCGAKFDYWFQYVTQANEKAYYEHMKHVLGLSFARIRDIKTMGHPRCALGLLKSWGYTVLGQFVDVRPLVKDPIAIFSAEWLASKFSMDVIVLIRHPAAVAGSLKRRNWTFPFTHLLEQPLLIRDLLSPFEEEIREYAENGHNVIDQASLVWRIVHDVIIKYQKAHPEWVFIRHEDLSRDPLTGFEELFERLGLNYSRRTRDVIRVHSHSSNPKESIENVDSLKRDSKSNIWNWKTRLTKEEIERIRMNVEDVAGLFYSDQDW